MPDGYEFIRVLGAGGFGEVVLARQTRLNRMVAVKRIHAAALGDTESLERFRREARLLATMDCPSVVRVFDLVRGPDGAHLVMEYVAGEPLSELVSRGPLPGSQAVVVLRDVADALAAAASRGIVHRDIKPHNVFVLPDGRAKLGDFGLARAVSDPGVFRTAADTTLGTPAYFPPELGQGEGEPDERSDAYSFAVVAYETLTGRRPYEHADAIALITAHWRLEPPDPRSLLPGLPRRAADTLLSGMAKDPASRMLPQELVSNLAKIPPDAWPTVERRPPRPRPDLRAAPTARVHVGSDSVPPTPRLKRRTIRRRSWVLLAVAGVAVLGSAVAWAAGRAGGPGELDVTSVRVTGDPSPTRVECPRAEVRLAAVVDTNGAGGRLTLVWTGPDGSTLARRQIDTSAGQRQVESRLTLTLAGRQPVRGDVVVAVEDRGLTASHPVVYRCPG
ncbi:serine/threonine-protein kinase [Nocardioides coralli]|uniref:serine/threonine-protein kinase n=1 Tax=Nocardioides coralli TaxID=2872154 RepID=UPI001CA43032|nr:serine/threonine-protein kinase [Nocardioides coralli]QZY30465.1 serine/threonine protein kinase [Nocardioides coralli]